MAPAALPHLSDDILAYMAAEFWAKSPVYDESDVCRDAAALMLAGHPLLTSLGEKLYRGLSPFLGQDSPAGVDEDSKVPQMKALLQEWGLPVGGKKAELWARITDELEGGTERCPVSRGARWRAAEQKVMRVTASWANSHLGISKNQVKKLPGVRDLDAPARGFGLWADAGVTTYALKDVKQAAREQWSALLARSGGWRNVERLLESCKSSKKEGRARKESCREQVVAEVVRRGTVGAVSVAGLLQVAMFDSAVCRFEWGRGTLADAADAVELQYLLRFCDYGRIKSQMEAEYRARVQRKFAWYRMRDEVEPKAQEHALQSWLRRVRASTPAASDALAAALAYAFVPASTHTRVRAAWDALQAEGTAGVGAGGAADGAAGPSGAATAPAGGGAVGAEAAAAPGEGASPSHSKGR